MAHVSALRVTVDFDVAVVHAVRESQRFDVAQLAAKYEPIIERPAVVCAVREPERQWNAVESAQRGADEYGYPNINPV